VEFICNLQPQTTSIMKNQALELKVKSSDIYIDFLSSTLGASKEEILEVAKRSGISTRRIAEYLVKQRSRPAEFHMLNEAGLQNRSFLYNS
jgi:hypothetical protein